MKKKWGSQTYPQRYEYDEQGRMTKLVTFQRSLDNSEPKCGDGRNDDMELLPGQRATLRQALCGRQWDRLHLHAWRAAAHADMGAAGWRRRPHTTYGYDNAGSLLTTDYSDSTPDVNLVRDRLGRVTSMTDASGTTGYAYRASDLQLERETHSGGVLNKTLARGYDSLGRPMG